MTITFYRPIALLALVCISQITHANDFVTKEQELVKSSGDALVALAKLRDNSTLNTTTALQVIDELIAPHFNFQLLARQALGKNWRQASEAQRQEVSSLFGNLLKKTYANALAKFSNQSLMHEPGTQTDNKGTIKIIVLNKGKKVNLEYTLTRADDVWNITDLKIERVSLLGNYRRQFNSIVRKNGIEGLIKLLKQKT